MDLEANADSICALEEQIREHGRTAIRFKRARNSLLNISKLPPEVLGNIFHCNTALKDDDFGGLDEGSHNFLLVCHHWFEVALRTPGIWSFWGNTPKDWARWYRRSETAPLDLVLGYGDYEAEDFDTNLRSALQGRATRDTIRRIHLFNDDPGLLSSIIASLTPNSEEVRPNSIESFILQNWSDMPVDLSDFFAHYRFPKLRHLDLTDCAISPWDRLTSRTSALTTLHLELNHPSLAPTTPQLLSIFASNPALQKVTLGRCAIPADGDGGESSSRVQLRHLKGFKSVGDLRHIVRLLHQLDLPRDMRKLSLYLHGCRTTDVSQVIGPYLRGLLQHRDRPQDGLKVSASSRYHTRKSCHITLLASDVKGINFSVPAKARVDRFFAITFPPNEMPDRSALEKATLDLITYIPREEVVDFRACNDSIATVDAWTQFPNLRGLSFDSVPLLTAFPSPLVEDGKILPSLDYILLENVSVNGGDWSPLVAFLTCRLSSGNRLDKLVVTNSSAMCPEVKEEIRGMVRKLRIV